jgi:hypothetical protein
MDWLTSDAIAQLRSILGDGPTDKWEFKTNVFPTPDGVTTRFFVGQTRVVDASLQVYLAGVETSVSGTPTYATGEFDLATAPGADDELQASFYYQWFLDSELAVFLDDAAQMLSLYDSATSGFVTLLDTSASSVSIAIGVRPSLLQFAAHNAYMRKAAETADSLQAGAPAGYSIDTNKRHPNWAGLAKMAIEQAKMKLEMYTDNPLNSKRALISTVAYRLPTYQPK